MATGRKILYFIGAGAPRAAGAYVSVQAGGHIPIPIQSEFWKVFLRLSTNRNAVKNIESFLFRYFLGYRRVPARSKSGKRRNLLNPIDVEEVFTFLSERSKAPSSSIQLKTYVDSIWQELVSQVGTVFSRFQPNKRTRQFIREFYRKHVKSFDAIVSFNYDIIFERSLPGNIHWGYAGLEDTTGKLSVLKPHGSINWGRRNGLVKRMKSPQHPVVVAPTHLKFVELRAQDANENSIGYLNDAQEISDVWEEMERQMKAAKVLIFIGYSFPVADLYFSSVLRSTLADREGAPSVVVVNPDAVSIANRLQKRFPIKRVLKYFDFGQFIEAGRSGVARALKAQNIPK